ncbi:zinc knuckle CX2CX4HX4C containing protein [Tanacetum coccineum]|uniref:Zinc knuckle CX2CX4HX4C containing protein n=1 Tax=Tanacetum coccineum TaxID=301880 RepID=A0ABQ4Z789_9ASTR
MTLVGYFVGLKMSHKEILGHLRRMWRAYQLDEVIINDYGLYFLKFKSDEGMQYILENGPWLVDGLPLFIQKWEAGMVLIEVDADLGLSDKIEVWYKSFRRSMELRVEYPWKPLVCSHCKVFGHGLDICLNRVLSDTEKKLKMDVNARRKVNIDHGENSNTGWKTMNNRKYRRNKDTSGGMYRQRNYYGEGSSSRGGFNGRGRGGMNGKGFGDQRFTRNDGAYYVSVKKNGAVGPISKRETDKTEKGKLKVDEGKFPRDNGIDSRVVSERMNIDKRVISKGIHGKKGSSKDINEGSRSNKGNVKEGLGSQNMFFVLSDEAEIEMNLVWESMKERIDEACEKGLRISLEEKNDWTEDLWIYFKEKMQELVRKENIKVNAMVKSVMIEKGLTENQAYRKVYDEVYRDEHDRIEEMIIKKQLVEVELFCKIRQVLSIVEMETWSEEKLGFFKNSIG